jgi:hypothetical protein
LNRLFKVETHLHTREGSACASGSGAEMVRAHRAAGYDGMIVTDHFFNGNTTVPANLPWSERVDLFCAGYENALREAGDSGFKVFFGWEYGYHGTEFLTYGLGKEYLADHPDILAWPLETYLSRIRRDGGFVSHAHPFREAPYIRRIRLYPGLVDAVEVCNASHDDPRFDVLAAAYAKENHLLTTSGSDTHHADLLLDGGMAVPHPVETIADFIKAVRESGSPK